MIIEMIKQLIRNFSNRRINMKEELTGNLIEFKGVPFYVSGKGKVGIIVIQGISPISYNKRMVLFPQIILYRWGVTDHIKVLILKN
jgi:hypothetical protein